MLAAYRVGDSPTNVLTPLMPYFALMIPYTLVLTVAWVLFFIAWYAIGIPLGPGWPVR